MDALPNLFDYTGKRCLMAGCFSGMGEAAARIVRSLGGTVVAVDFKRPTTFECERYFEVDLRDPRAIEQMVAETAASGPIDRLFYCAGLPGSRPKLDAIQVNFLALRHTVETAAPHMPPNGAAAVISSSAGLGHMGAVAKIKPLLDTQGFDAGQKWIEEHIDEVDGYVFPKMAAILYVMHRAATLTLETGVRLNCTSPGPTDTPMMPEFVETNGRRFMEAYPKPIGRNSTAEEQGWPLVFLNSDAASYISGENLYSDGGGAAAIQLGLLAPDLSLLGKD